MSGGSNDPFDAPRQRNQLHVLWLAIESARNRDLCGEGVSRFQLRVSERDKQSQVAGIGVSRTLKPSDRRGQGGRLRISRGQKHS